ncbi:MAG TPA: hypothetical protein VF271_06310 [Rhodanobacteraceae bacterium]
MRSFNDDNGNPWQAALMDGSYGNILLMFTRLGADDTRQRVFDADCLADAEQALAATDDAGLRKLLATSEPWAV